MPGEPAFGLQLRLEFVLKRLQVERVIPRIPFHPLGKWAQSPVGFLWTFLQLHAEIFFDKIAVAKLSLAHQARGEHGIKDRARNKLMVLQQESQIVIGTVHDELVFGQRIEHGCKADRSQWIDQNITFDRADLDEANFFGISMKAVGFSIDCNPVCSADLRKKLRQLLFRIDHAQNIKVSRMQCQALFYFN